MRLPCRRLLDEKDRCRPQRPVRREPDVSPGPQAPAVELRDAPQRVVAAGVTVAGEVPDGLQDPEDRRARSGAERRAQVVQKRGPLVAEEFVEPGDVPNECRHATSWNNYD